MDAGLGLYAFIGAVVAIFAVAALHFLVTSRNSPPTAESSGLNQRTVEPVARSLAAALWYGALLGLLVGGVGSRLAMRLLFLTSGDEVRGLTSDDGFMIGRFDLGDTLGLILLGTVVGVLGGPVYLLIRRWLPRSRPLRGAMCAAGGGVVVGSMLVHDEGIDFHALGPLWLAVALFVLIPALFGLLISLLVDRSDRSESWFQRKPVGVTSIPFVAMILPPVLIAVGIPFGLSLLLRKWAGRSPRALALWESAQLKGAGLAILLVIGAFGTLALFNDVRALI